MDLRTNIPYTDSPRPIPLNHSYFLPGIIPTSRGPHKHQSGNRKRNLGHDPNRPTFHLRQRLPRVIRTWHILHLSIRIGLHGKPLYSRAYVYAGFWVEEKEVDKA